MAAAFVCVLRQDGAMARFGDGLALDADVVTAAQSAARQALAALDGRTPDLVCAFVSGGDPDAVGAAGERVAGVMGATAMVGCSSAGVIGRGRGIEGRAAVSVWAGVLPGATLRSFHLEVMRADEGMAVIGLPERGDEKVALLFADPHSFPADGFVTRANDSLDGLAFVGGLASGPRGAGSTRLWVDGRTVDRGAVGVLLGGDLGARTVVSQGCRPIGPVMTVTAAAGNVITGLAGMPALQKVESLLAELTPADQALASTGLQLGIALDEYAEEHERGSFLVRGILGVDAASSGLVVGDLVEVGRTVRLQVRDAEAADEDLRELLAGFRRTGHDAAVGGALLFSCNGRGAAMFGQSMGGADHDVTVVRRELSTTGVAGFFAAGELGPVAGRNHLHGLTASVLTFPA
jgi:small ligand-binding sensory domain FIST